MCIVYLKQNPRELDSVFLFSRHASVYGSVFAIEDFAASVGFAFGTYFANSTYIIFYLT